MGPEIIQGGCHIDSRGILIHFNELHLDPVKRFYLVSPTGVGTVRAWQGHKKERKWFYVLAGSFKIVVVKPDDWVSPSAQLSHTEYTISSQSNQVLFVPSGLINGFKALEAGSQLMVFSDLTLEESLQDDFRFDSNLWFPW